MVKLESEATFRCATCLAAGGYAYDDGERGNGVFTASIVDGLRCQAESDARGFVTVEGLRRFVNQQVAEWIRVKKGRELARGAGIEANLGGPVSKMPLARCEAGPLFTPAESVAPQRRR